MREYQNKSLEKALSILDCFSREQRELTASEIARTLGLNLSSIYPLLSTLEKFKYIVRKENGKYGLGINLIIKGNLVLSGLNLIEIARVPLHNLAHEYRGNAHLAILNNWKALIVDRSLASDRVFINSIIGFEIPLYCTSLGRALLAFLDPEEINSYLRSTEFRKFTPSTPIDPDTILKELNETRLRGYVIIDEEFTPGELCFAAPIFNSQGRVVASMNIALNKLNRLLDHEVYALKVIQTAREISGFLGYMGPTAG